MAEAAGAKRTADLGPVIFASVAAWAAVGLYFASAHGHMDRMGEPHALGRDFVIFWTAAHMAADGQALDVFKPAEFLSAARRLFDPALPFHFWSYPPTALLNVLPLGRMAYLPALALWSAAGGLAVVVAGRMFFGSWRPALLLLASPAVAMGVVMGQNGLFTGALLLAALTLIDRRPILSGVFMGLLGFKPQIGVLLPVATLAARRWRTFTAAGAVAVAMVGLSILVFGVQAWRAFAAFTIPEQAAMMVGTGAFRWGSPAAFMSGLILFGPGWGPLLLQALFTAIAVWLGWRAYRTPREPRLQAAVLFVASFLATPQSFNYDMVPIAAAALVLLSADRSTPGRLLALGLWLAPFAVVPLNAKGLPVMPLVLALAAWRLDQVMTNVTGSATKTGENRRRGATGNQAGAAEA